MSVIFHAIPNLNKNKISTCCKTHYIFNIYAIIILKIQKNMKIRKKSTENFFSVDNRSTINFHKTSQTRHQLISLLKNHKKINIDQL